MAGGPPHPPVTTLILGPAKPPQSGPFGAEFLRFFGPCGAKSWGGGGAPPTNLILLRNQTKSSEPRRRPSRTRIDGRSVAWHGRRRRSATTPTAVQAPEPPTPTHPTGASGVVGGEWHFSEGERTASNAGPDYLRLRKLRLRRFALPRIHSRKSPRFPLSRPRCSVIRSGASLSLLGSVVLDHL